MQTAAGSPVGSPQSLLMLTLSLPTVLFDAVSSHDHSPEKVRQTKKPADYDNCFISVYVKSWNSSRSSNDVLYVDIKALCQ